MEWRKVAIIKGRDRTIYRYSQQKFQINNILNFLIKMIFTGINIKY